MYENRPKLKYVPKEQAHIVRSLDILIILHSMGGFFLVMDSYGHVDNFQPVFVRISMIFPLKNVR